MVVLNRKGDEMKMGSVPWETHISEKGGGVRSLSRKDENYFLSENDPHGSACQKPYLTIRSYEISYHLVEIERELS